MLKLIVLFVVAILAIVAVLAALRPNTFRIQRSVRIKAPPERIFPFINDLQRFRTWSPFEHDELKRTFSGPTSGPGATYDFDGPASKGVGRCAITEASPPTRVVMKLDMTKPMAAHNTIEFTLEPQGEFTEVTWAMWGENGFMPKLMGLFMNLEDICGRDFDKGLSALKQHVEGGPSVLAAPAGAGATNPPRAAGRA